MKLLILGLTLCSLVLGEPEEQMRAKLEEVMTDLKGVCGQELVDYACPSDTTKIPAAGTDDFSDFVKEYAECVQRIRVDTASAPCAEKLRENLAKSTPEAILEVVKNIKQNYLDAFDKTYDLNHDGLFTLEEANAVVKKPAERENLFKTLDRDNNQIVTKEEYDAYADEFEKKQTARLYRRAKFKEFENRETPKTDPNMLGGGPALPMKSEL